MSMTTIAVSSTETRIGSGRAGRVITRPLDAPASTVIRCPLTSAPNVHPLRSPRKPSPRHPFGLKAGEKASRRRGLALPALDLLVPQVDPDRRGRDHRLERDAWIPQPAGIAIMDRIEGFARHRLNEQAVLAGERGHRVRPGRTPGQGGERDLAGDGAAKLG